MRSGGQGTAAKIQWDRVPPEVEPFSPYNLLIFSAGLLDGTPVPAANRTSVDTFSPQTNLYSHSLFGGFWGVGDALASGIYWAACQIGKGAEAFDHNTMKKFEQLPLKLGSNEESGVVGDGVLGQGVQWMRRAEEKGTGAR